MEAKISTFTDVPSEFLVNGKNLVFSRVTTDNGINGTHPFGHAVPQIPTFGEIYLPGGHGNSSRENVLGR
jgi:hypothetical protein